MRIRWRLVSIVIGCSVVACGGSPQVTGVDDCVELWRETAERDLIAEIELEFAFELDRIEVDFSEDDRDHDRNYCIQLLGHPS